MTVRESLGGWLRPASLRLLPSVGPVLVVVAVAAALRFAFLVAQGVVEYDEGWLIDVARRSALEWSDGGLRSYSNFKSSHTTWASLVLSLRLFGISPSSIQYPFALYGLLGVACVMWLASLGYGRRTALLAGALLAVSPMHVLYSRTVSVDAPGAAFVLLSWAFLSLSPGLAATRERTAGSFVAGIAMGLAVTANYRAFATCIVPVAALLVLERSWREIARLAAAYLAGFVTLLVAWDMVLRAVFPVSGGYLHAFLFVDQSFFRQGFGDVGGWLSRFQLREPDFYLRALTELDNPVVLGLAALLPFLSWGIRTPGPERRRDLAVLIAILAPALAFALMVFKAPRAFSFVQPLIVVAAARSIQLTSRCCRSLRPATLRPLLPAALAALAATWGLVRTLSPDVLGRTNPFRTAFRDVGRDAGGASGKPGILVILDGAGPDLYATETGRRIERVAIGATLGDVVLAAGRGFRYLLVDGQLSVYETGLSCVWPAFKTVSPQMLVPAASYIRLDHFAEHTVYLHTTYAEEERKYRTWLGRWGPNLPVYDLARLVSPLPWQGSPSGWYRAGDGIVAMAGGSAPSSSARAVWDETRPADVVEASIADEYNRLPFEGGLVLRAAGGDTVALYLDLRKDGRTAAIVPLASGGDLGPPAASYTIPLMEQVRTIRLSWSDGVVRGFVNGAPVLSVDRPLPPGRPVAGLVSPARGGFEVLSLGSRLDARP